MVYLNFTTTALFKSAKVPATLIGGYLTGQKTRPTEMAMAVGMALGIFLFGVAERFDSPKFRITGLVLISINLVVSSFSSNLQQLVLQTSKKEETCTSSVDRLMVHQYSAAAIVTLSWCLVSGEL